LRMWSGKWRPMNETTKLVVMVAITGMLASSHIRDGRL
jgi:hypothetical protein